MSGEFDIYGVYFPALVVFAAIAFVVTAWNQTAPRRHRFLPFRLASPVGRSGDLRNLACRHHGGGHDYLATGMSH